MDGDITLIVGENQVKNIDIILKSGLLDIKSGRAIINFDAEGNIGTIEISYFTYNKHNKNLTNS